MICNRIEECKEEINYPKKTLIDKKGGNSEYLIDNKSKSTYSIIDFENCVYKNNKNNTKCDYGVETKNSILYIELKGSEVRKGIKQLLATINETEECFKGLDKKSRLVISRFPKPNIVKKSKEYKDLVKKMGAVKKLLITKNSYTEII